MNTDSEEAQKQLYRHYNLNLEEEKLNTYLYQEQKVFDTFIHELINLICMKLSNNIYTCNTVNQLLVHNSHIITIKKTTPIVMCSGGMSYRYYNHFFRSINDTMKMSLHAPLTADWDIQVAIKGRIDSKKLLNDVMIFIQDNVKAIKLNTNCETLELSDLSHIITSKPGIMYKYNKYFVLTSESSKRYTTIYMHIKFNGKIVKLIEILFWNNKKVGDYLNIVDIENNGINLIHLDDDIIIPVMELSQLIYINSISIQNRIFTEQINKCSKDFARIYYVNNLIQNKLNTTDLQTKQYFDKVFTIISKYILNIKSIPFHICSDKNIPLKLRKALIVLYNKYFNTEPRKFLNIMLSIAESRNEKDIINRYISFLT